jgi:hypothetical protein
MTTRMKWLALAGVAGVLSGCSTERTTRESHGEGSWSPADFELLPGSSLSLENATTHERVAIEVADDGRVHAERATGGRLDTVDADSFEALKRDHPEFVDALRAFRIDYRFRWELTTEVGGD